MSDNPNNYGLLLNKDIKLHRLYFKQMVKLLGINCIYKAPLPGKTYDTHGDLDTGYYQPVLVGCIFQDHPDQKTLKKMGWVAELQENSSIIHVPYDLPHLLFQVVLTKRKVVYSVLLVCKILWFIQLQLPARLLQNMQQLMNQL